MLTILPKNDLQELARQLHKISPPISLPNILICLSEDHLAAYAQMKTKSDVLIPPGYWKDVTLDEFEQWVMDRVDLKTPQRFGDPEQYLLLDRLHAAIKTRTLDPSVEGLIGSIPDEVLRCANAGNIREGLKKVRETRAVAASKPASDEFTESDDSLDQIEAPFWAMMQSIADEWPAHINAPSTPFQAYVTGDDLTDFQSQFNVGGQPGGRPIEEDLRRKREAWEIVHHELIRRYLELDKDNYGNTDKLARDLEKLTVTELDGNAGLKKDTIARYLAKLLKTR